MSDNSELICAYLLDGKGGGTPLDWAAVNSWTPGSGDVWVHLDCAHEGTDHWLREHSKLDTFVIDGLLSRRITPPLR